MLSDCIILAGGMGTRLQSVLIDKPKCLADINGKPFLYYICQQLKKFNFNKIIFSVGYQKDMVKDYVLTHRDEFNFTFEFAEEDEPLGTGGAILHALSYSQTEDFFVVNGDTLFDVDLEEMLALQRAQMSDCTLALKPMQHADRYGLVHMDEKQVITGFEEKKLGATGLINGGIYCIYRNSFLNIPFPKKFSFEKDYLEAMIKEREIIGYKQDAYFIDIGIPEDYQRAQLEIPALFTKENK